MLQDLIGQIEAWLSRDTVRERLPALRLAAAVLLISFLLLNVSTHWFWPGLAISAFGLLLQLWVFGSARGSERLSINGPYMFVRNPLCLARFFLVLGLVLMTGIPWLIPVFVILYVPWVLYRVQREEDILQEKEPAEYLQYAKHVPRFLPRFRPYPKGRFLYFRTRYFKRHFGLENLLVFAGVYILCYVIAYYPF